MSNDQVGLSGVYEMPNFETSHRTGLTLDQVVKNNTKFSTDNKFKFYKDFIQIVNCDKYNQYNSPPLKIALKKELNRLPENVKSFFCLKFNRLPHTLWRGYGES